MADGFPHNLRLGDGGPDLRIPDGDDGRIIVLDTPDVELNVIDADEAEEEPESKHTDNIVDKIDKGVLLTMAVVLERGIQIDEMSRSEWLETRAKGMSLLGLRIKPARSDGGDVSAPVEGISTYDDPLLLEAVIRGAANAFAELCPADGPVKIRNDDLDTTGENDFLAEALEQEYNHFLTVTASEYYPETDRVLLLAYLGGTSFKKGYHCPIRNRPVLEGIDAVDLIVSNDVTDLRNAARITHCIKMDPATFRRMQNLGVYSDVPLVRPQAPQPNSAQQARMDISGVKVGNALDDSDRERELYECYCKYEIPGFGKGGLLDGVPLPWKVTIDKSSREIISVVRNWDEDDEQCLPKEVFIDYTYIRGFGFYGIGLLHVLGNTTNGLSAATREMIDAGMFASFPGWLYALDGPDGKQLKSIFRIPPGGGKGVQTGGRPINQWAMPIPYKDPSPGLMSLTESIRSNGQRLGGTADIEVGEGRQDAPVGTTLALLEQASKPMDAVHKRLYQSQAREFRLLTDLFREDPEALWRHRRRQRYTWTAEIVLQALNDYDLVPMADPNTSSHMQRVGRLSALQALAQQSPPGLFMPYQTASTIMKGMRLGNPAYLLNPNFDAQQGQQPPQDPAKMLAAQAQQTAAQAKLADAQNAIKVQEMKSSDVAKQEQGRQVLAQANVQKDMMMARSKMFADMQRQRMQHQSDANLQTQQLQASAEENRRKNLMDAMQASADRTHQAQQSLADRNHQAQQGMADRTHQAIQNQTPKPAPQQPQAPFGSLPQ